ncbi:MAG: hypothetical protein GC179_10685 [Anaerolineaceae bacterium]|nr:hypothetical protein [Anaerolineaceae bacterium]
MIQLFLRLITLITVFCLCLIWLVLGASKMLVMPNNQIVFTATINTPDMHIYLMDIARRIIYDMNDEGILGYEPAWSPDGQQIAFVGAGAKGFTIYNRDLGSSITHELINNPGGVYSPTWSPDGQLMSYVTIGSGRLSKVMLTDLQSGTTRQITDTLYQNDSHPTWSPDNRYIAFVTNTDTFGKSDIDILELQTGRVHPMFRTEENQYFPRWSPDGRYIAYISQGYNVGIYVWDVQQSKPFMLYNNLAQKGALDWSPDGRYIIYADFISYNHSGIFRLDTAQCLDSNQLCYPQLITSTNGLFTNPRYRPHTS